MGSTVPAGQGPTGAREQLVAASGDTWGIPGPTFLTFYLVTAVAVTFGVLIARTAVFAGRPPAPDALGPHEAAFLAGGETLAAYASIAGLRVSGAIGAAPGAGVGERALAVSGPLPPGSPPLDAAIHRAAWQQCPTQELLRDPGVAGVLGAIRQYLENAGLLVDRQRMRLARQATAALFVVTLLGYARVVAGSGNDKPVSNMIFASLAMTVISLVLVSRTPVRTRAAKVALNTLRRRNRHLAPSQRPSWVTYGAAGTAMAVAVYGVGSVWAMDPAFAAEAGLRQHVLSYGGASTSAGATSNTSAGSGSGSDTSCGSSSDGGGAEAAVVAGVAAAAVAAVGENTTGGPSTGAGAASGTAGQREYGVGIGWRPEIAGYIKDLPGLRFVEVVSESLPADAPIPSALLDLLARGVAVIPHGTRLSLGGAEPVAADRIQQFAAAVDRLKAPMASEHIAFVRAGGIEAGHLLPLPRTREAVDAVVANVRLVRQELDVPFALEPIAAIFDWPEDELTEGQFISEILERTDSLLLLDVANVYANAINRGQAPDALFDRVPLERVAYAHVAGGSVGEGVYHDTHTDPVPAEVLDLVAELCRRHRPPALMLERDGHYPPAAELTAELDAIAAASGYPRITR